MRQLIDIVNVIADDFWHMNNHINAHGQIKRSSQVIKQWHTYTNDDWDCILGIAKLLSDRRKIKLNAQTERDLETLLNHLDKYRDNVDNVLYPEPKITNTLPYEVVNIHRDTTVKTVVFRTMMNVREALCEALDIYLPNLDSSKGLLTPTAFDENFSFVLG